MNNTDTKDFEEVAGQGDDIPDEGELPKKPLKFSAEIIERDKRKVDIVEVNLKDASAKVVESSKAPKLTKKALKEKGAPIQTGKTVFDGETIEVDMWHGVSLALDIARSNIIDAYKDRDLNDLATFTERETAVKRLMLSGIIPDTFSYQGHPQGLPPIEECTDILLNALWDAYINLHFPIEDSIYQVKVVRGVPLDVNQMLGKTFEMYPVGDKPNTAEMVEDELEMFVERSDAQRSVIVSSMVIEPCLSLDGESGGKHPYPVEDLSEWMMQCLYAAYRVSNAPARGQVSLQRFLRQFTNRIGEERNS